MDAIQVQRKQKQCINFELIKINYNFHKRTTIDSSFFAKINHFNMDRDYIK